MLCLLHHLSRPPPPDTGFLPPCVLHLFVLYTIPLRSKLAAKTLLLFPAQPRVGVSRKQKNREELP